MNVLVLCTKWEYMTIPWLFYHFQLFYIHYNYGRWRSCVELCLSSVMWLIFNTLNLIFAIHLFTLHFFANIWQDCNTHTMQLVVRPQWANGFIQPHLLMSVVYLNAHILRKWLVAQMFWIRCTKVTIPRYKGNWGWGCNTEDLTGRDVL